MTPSRTLTDYRAILFDLDGVLTPTADVHRQAWAETFAPYLAAEGLAEYTEDDYFQHLDGKKRYDGVADLLASRGRTLPWGDPGEPGSLDTVCGIGNLKNDVFSGILERDGVTPYPGSVALLDQAIGAGLAVAVVSSSQNAESVLSASGLRNRFAVVIDGAVAMREHLAGKPAPAMFLRAAELLGVGAGESVVIEDAVSGVAAAHAGGFALVIGVDRGVGSQELIEAGAHHIVGDLAELIEATDPAPSIPQGDAPPSKGATAR